MSYETMMCTSMGSRDCVWSAAETGGALRRPAARDHSAGRKQPAWAGDSAINFHPVSPAECNLRPEGPQH